MATIGCGSAKAKLARTPHSHLHDVCMCLGRCLLTEISTPLIKISALLDENSGSLV